MLHCVALHAFGFGHFRSMNEITTDYSVFGSIAPLLPIVNIAEW